MKDKIQIKNFNFKHPELRENEEFIINVPNGEVWDKPDFIEYIRMGEIAYSTSGNIVPDMKPMFGKYKKK